MVFENDQYDDERKKIRCNKLRRSTFDGEKEKKKKRHDTIRLAVLRVHVYWFYITFRPFSLNRMSAKTINNENVFIRTIGNYIRVKYSNRMLN